MADLSGRHCAMTKSAHVCASASLRTQNGNFNQLFITQGGKLPFEILCLKDLNKNDQKRILAHSRILQFIIHKSSDHCLFLWITGSRQTSSWPEICRSCQRNGFNTERSNYQTTWSCYLVGWTCDEASNNVRWKVSSS